VTGQPSGASASSTLDALRQVRASRAAWRLRLLPLLVVLVGGVVYLSAKAHPGVGLHGASLALSIGLAGFAVGVFGVRQTMLRHQTPARVYGPFLALLLLSSALLLWVQPTGPGAGGCVVAVAVAIAAGAIPARLGLALIVATICVAAFVITRLTNQHAAHQGTTSFLASVFSFSGLFLFAMLIWRFRQNDEQSQRLLTQMEETRDAELRAAALAERQRLAREMHDVLAHSLSGLVVQLEGARLLALSDPTDDRLATTIDRAHQLARSGLDEARLAIGMLRDDELPSPEGLAALARSFEADTGVPCLYSATGQLRELRSAVKLALYRVTQEALTNVRKHAHPARVEVRVEYLPNEVTLAIEDFSALRAEPLPADTSHPGGGYGLTGMRERAELLGGTLTAAPTDHGFLVRLRAPA
jgi:signal transduction histidine kinase